MAENDLAKERTVGKAGFLGGLLAFVFLVALSVVGVGHARTLEGAANAQYWIIVAIVTAAQAFVIAALGRTHARGPAGETFRKAGVAIASLWLLVFVWETLAIGTGAFAGPLELAWTAWKG